MKWPPGASPSPLLIGPYLILRVLLFLLTTSHVPSLLADPDGFISIDCGGSDWTADDTNITWIPDTNYTVFGNIATVKVDTARPYDTLRYFPDTTIERTCIILNTIANSTYLLRAGFLYGNYDAKYNNSTSELPKFSLLLDATDWTNVTFTSINETVLHEMIYLATHDTASICVARSDKFDPFISSLELRKLPANAASFYSPVANNYLMKTNSRVDFGESTGKEIRYPNDTYDRIWYSDSTIIQNISMYGIVLNQSIVSQYVDFPPSIVMQTARSSIYPSVMSFNFKANYGPGSYYIAFYFTSINSSFLAPLSLSVGNQSATVDVSTPKKFYSDNYTVYGNSYSLQLSTNDTSGRPFLNAAESYILQSVNPSTFAGDVNALEEIKASFNLSSYMGDPCVPYVYTWSWITCNLTSPARVISLNLSSRGLQSEIPSAIADLSALVSIDLHNNSLIGEIPSALVNLSNLTLLDLSNNNLSGTVPVFRNADVRINGNEQLCQANCESSGAPAPSSVPALDPGSGSTSHTALIIGSVIGGILFFLVVFVGCILFGRRSRKKRRLFSIHSAHWPPVPYFTEISRSVDSSVGTMKASTDDVPVYSFSDMQIITNNFGKMLASERFGSLFYGTLPSGEEVVVKLLQSNIQISPIEFLSQVGPLSYVNHRNLLRPIGFCAETHRLMFVYEHVQKGSLYDHLYSNEPLDWRTRLNILQQVAQGLEYLHYACNPSIMHGNLKSTNVLMSRDGALAKISDFGIYGLSQNVDATSGYLDPQYFEINRLTEESDVYSFGVLTLEVVCGRIPFDTSLPKEAWKIVEWVRKTLQEGNYELIVDPCLYDSWSVCVVSKIVQLALRATEADMKDRPTMSEIAMEFKEAYKIEPSNHVVFAEMEPYAISSSPDIPLTLTYSNSSHEPDLSHK